MKKKTDEKTCEPARPKVLAAQTTDEIIAVMHEEDAAEERQKILRRMNPACRKKLEYIEKWFRTEVSRTLRSRYELGLAVREMYEDEKNNGKVYGKNAIGKICKVLKWDDGVIRKALHFAETYTPEDLKRLCAQLLPSGEPLTWSHVSALLVVEDRDQREELLLRTVSEEWTCTDLAHAIKQGTDRPDRDGRGRPLRVPTDFDSAVVQQQQKAEEWDRRHTRVWAAPGRALTAHAAKLQSEEVTEQRLRDARVLAVQLRRVADQAVAQAEQAEQVVKDFERILDERRSRAKSTTAER